MQYTKLRLKNHKRLSLNNISDITLNFTSILQIILGSNGSGKSSLLNELTMWPGTPSDFRSGGQKHIEGWHRGKFYRAISNYNGKTGKHSLVEVVDGVETELNEGGTGGIQKKLIEEIFNYNTKVHDVLTGNVRFTSMSPSQRKDWLSTLSTNDFTFANNLFKDITTSYRDVLGARKKTQERLGNALDKVVDEEMYLELKKRQKLLSEQIEELMSNRDLDVDPSPVESKLEMLLSEQLTITKRVLNSRPRYLNDPNVKSDEDLDKIISDVTYKLKLNESEQSSIKNRLSDVDEMLSKLTTGEGGVEVVYRRLDDIRKELDGLENPNIANSKHLTADMEAMEQQLRTILESVVCLGGDILGKVEGEDLCSELKSIKERIQLLEIHIPRIEGQLEDMSNARDVTCPSCNYVWRPGVSEKEEAALKTKLDAARKELADKLKTKDDIEDSCVKFAEFEKLLANLKYLEEMHPVAMFWDKALEFDLRGGSATAIMGEFVTILSKLKEQNKYDELIAQAKSAESIVGQHEQLTKGTDLGDFTSKHKELASELEVKFNDHEAYSSELSKLKTFKAFSDMMSSSLDRLEFLDREIAKTFKTYLQQSKSKVLESTLRDKQSSLASVSKSINDKDLMMGIVNDLKINEEELSQDSESYSLLVGALSNTSGLIASQIRIFINSFVVKLNEIIGQIWEYDLIVQPCDIEKGELDYKFPLVVKHDDMVVPDISRGSQGQKDVIDLAFTLMVSRFMDLTDFPLYLDETGASFDEEHRSKFTAFIKTLVERHNCSQVFLVNHYQAVHGALTGAEFCVLDSKNITVPKTYNTHVEIA